ncbi:putative F420-dependent oxidoreductase, Rv2161c family [Mycolicibacterium phlei]|jgi:probable F420-dependent oxidoreductase|uniref:N5,N10-methylenetetrahydromethanopterin reductase n=1 Tax=Mycolicibacterium phlei DSM 43239 = CCUG 21000 TaxID=1226750 RepID=A0A5N5V2J1_MYCPH|nr:LLM class F420-dependent oxidoreductase [Mycolicibacterium phlei]VEG12002.1 putative F420-dependent oxidoreductase, Rv2161c family [Mycobacteroides chelonae]AMO63912.1 Alkanesulfonate monooxygenase [Mycolicibacterium phlei]EID09252.1 luciferase family protein [Mycolicibacterium phlei RIVM601174]KAB7754700.1 N5,N10-methylenetetrahydromethanopterin reductase [Mycolicibacterium phlei DSM 43239 = CCUG 21000]KXW65344.1 N5,N10-methylenetetrahydromethanopterin reductase [Mycolicibacterium phlei DS
MEFGISTFVNDDTIDTVTLARAIEERGFHALAIAEHTHIPASRESAYPGGGELPDYYYRTLDPFVTLAAAAAVTSRIELITGIALLIQRDPIITAKETASIDLISGGRFVFGVGAGWNLEEMRHHGTDPKTRGALLDERIEAIKALWTTEPAEYHGTYVDFDASYLRPKPVQKPHPPILVGGDSNATVKRVIRHGAGWMSNPLPVDRLRMRIDQIRDGAGHDVPLSTFGTPIDPGYWDALQQLGYRQANLILPTRPRDESLRLLDEYAEKVAAYRG